MPLNFQELLRTIIVEDTRYDILMSKYAQPKKAGREALIPKDKLRLIMLADPTTRSEDDNSIVNSDIDGGEIQKVGAYTNWIVRQYMMLQMDCDKDFKYGTPEFTECLKEKQRLFFEDLYKVTEDLQKYDYLKKTKKFEGQKDIGKIKSIVDLYDEVKGYNVNKEELTTTKAERLRDDVTKVYEDDTWLIMIPKSKEASCHYGGGQTRWCTASKSSNYFDHYSKQGPLYMMMHKEDGNKSPSESRSHQFHFESNSFYNAEDRSTDLGQFFTKYPELKPFFKDKFSAYLEKDFSNNVALRYPNDTMSKYIAIYGFEEFFEALPLTLERLDIEVSGGDSGNAPAFKLPNDIDKFKNLQMLHIEGMLSEIPPEVGNLKKLNFISIPNNPKLKSLPKELGNLESLEVLNIKNIKNISIPEEVMRKVWCDGVIFINNGVNKTFDIRECNGKQQVVNFLDDSGRFSTEDEAKAALELLEGL
jgi:hypothetical protein